MRDAKQMCSVTVDRIARLRMSPYFPQPRDFSRGSPRSLPIIQLPTPYFVDRNLKHTQKLLGGGNSSNCGFTVAIVDPWELHTRRCDFVMMSTEYFVSV